jgi:hypothetical protein
MNNRSQAHKTADLMWEHLWEQIEKGAIEPLYTSKFTQEGESKDAFCNRVYQTTKKQFLWFD